MYRSIVLVVLAMLALLPQGAQAHKPSDSYLTLTLADDTLSGQWDIALRDLDFAIGLDSNGDGAITWGELKARNEAVTAYALARLRIGPAAAPCALISMDTLTDQHSDGGYAVLLFRADCAPPTERLDLGYRLLFDLDPQHRGLLQIRAGARTQTAIFSPERPAQVIVLGEPRFLTQVFDYFREGVWHIWVGYDHVLFLLTLLLPAVVVRRGGAWRPVEAFSAALVAVAKVVTAFTLAHSVTLSLAALEVIALPTRLVESAIAASVLAAALNNIWPVVTRHLWLVAFAFGLVHGFGFASVLADLGLPGGTLLAALAGFNIGVEAGQLAIVAVFLPVAYWVRDHALYGKLALRVGSGGIAAIGAVWLLKRMFNLALPLV